MESVLPNMYILSYVSVGNKFVWNSDCDSISWLELSVKCAVVVDLWIFLESYSFTMCMWWLGSPQAMAEFWVQFAAFRKLIYILSKIEKVFVCEYLRIVMIFQIYEAKSSHFNNLQCIVFQVTENIFLWAKVEQNRMNFKIHISLSL